MKRNFLIILFSSLLLFSIFNIIKITKEYEKSTDIYNELNNSIIEIITTEITEDITSTENISETIIEESSLNTTTTETTLVTEETTLTIEKNSTIIEESYKENTEITDNIQIKIDWSKLPPTVIGWIYIENTNINYPIVQSDNNEYYLKHLYNGEKNSAGSIFLDYKNNLFNDKNSIIYGHNMKNGSMFHELKNFLKKDFFKKENSIYILTRNETIKYKVYSAYSIKYYGKDEFSQYEINPQNYEEWLKQTIKNSKYSSNINLSSSNSIITLSTCMGGDKELRCIVHAAKIN